MQHSSTATQTVPLLDLKAQYRSIEAEVQPALREVCESCRFALGPAVESFEKAFASYCSAHECVAVNSGTSALHLAMRCLDIGPGDEVITVPMTFVATAWAISYTGARPVFVDIDPFTRTMDPLALEAAITSRTRAIVPVHLYGQAADMDRILSIAARYGIPVIEDAAQAHGATYEGRKVGGLGTIGCFSFYPGKNLGAYGEGGALVTNDRAIAQRARQLRDHGQSRRYCHEEIGYNYRMDGMQGAVLGIKLKYLDRWNEQRRRHAAAYRRMLANVPEIEMPAEASDRQSVYHLFVIEAPDRDVLMQRLSDAGVQTGLHYPSCVHQQPAYMHLNYHTGMFPIAERLAARCLSLPMYPELTGPQLEQVCEAITAAVKQ